MRVLFLGNGGGLYRKKIAGRGRPQTLANLALGLFKERIFSNDFPGIFPRQSPQSHEKKIN
jgi:hypothetical protein